MVQSVVESVRGSSLVSEGVSAVHEGGREFQYTVTDSEDGTVLHCRNLLLRLERLIYTVSFTVDAPFYSTYKPLIERLFDSFRLNKGKFKRVPETPPDPMILHKPDSRIVIGGCGVSLALPTHWHAAHKATFRALTAADVETSKPAASTSGSSDCLSPRQTGSNSSLLLSDPRSPSPSRTTTSSTAPVPRPPMLSSHNSSGSSATERLRPPPDISTSNTGVLEWFCDESETYFKSIRLMWVDLQASEVKEEGDQIREFVEEVKNEMESRVSWDGRRFFSNLAETIVFSLSLFYVCLSFFLFLSLLFLLSLLFVACFHVLPTYSLRVLATSFSFLMSSLSPNPPPFHVLSL